MKILKNPTAITEWSCETTCTECEAVLEVDSSDISYVFRSQKDGDDYYAKCPFCHTQLYLSTSSMPRAVKRALDKRLSNEEANSRDVSNPF